VLYQYHHNQEQALVDFIAEWMPTLVDEVEVQSSLLGEEGPEHWTMYFDGSIFL
jgi:hypothetical protein